MSRLLLLIHFFIIILFCIFVFLYCGAGQTMLHRRQDDIRLLKLDVAEGQRRVLVTSKLRGIIPGLDLDMASLQKQLLETRRSADHLALQLESPDNKTRSPPCLWFQFTDSRHIVHKVFASIFQSVSWYVSQGFCSCQRSASPFVHFLRFCYFVQLYAFVYSSSSVVPLYTVQWDVKSLVTCQTFCLKSTGECDPQQKASR